jgi:D-lactate dehydrogenase
MRIAVFSTKNYDQHFLTKANEAHGHRHELTFFEPRLIEETVTLAAGFPAVCAFVNDRLDARVLRALKENGTELIALRSAGFNHVDLEVADELGLCVARVPAYSPQAVAEHALALILSLNRRIPRAYNRVRDGNFSLEGMLGFDLHGKTVGIIGTGRIGLVFAELLQGFGCTLLAFDPYPNEQAERVVEYVPLRELFERSDVISLHCPLTPETHRLIDREAVSQMKDGVMLINTSRGRLVDTLAVIDGLKSGRIGYLGLDVYEEEENLFFEDLSEHVIQDDTFTRLLTFPNVLITGHQAFFTREALTNIAEKTLANVTAFESGEGELHCVTADKLA